MFARQFPIARCLSVGLGDDDRLCFEWAPRIKGSGTHPTYSLPIHSHTPTVVAMACIIPYIMLMSFVCYQITNFIYPLRVGEKSEKLGLDMSQHKESIMVEHDEDFKAVSDELDASNRIELGSM